MSLNSIFEIENFKCKRHINWIKEEFLGNFNENIMKVDVVVCYHSVEMNMNQPFVFMI